eukprot:Filipodium_phascolosomae@DN1488_c0_g1_i2.p1
MTGTRLNSEKRLESTQRMHEAMDVWRTLQQRMKKQVDHASTHPKHGHQSPVIYPKDILGVMYGYKPAHPEERKLSTLKNSMNRDSFHQWLQSLSAVCHSAEKVPYSTINNLSHYTKPSGIFL